MKKIAKLCALIASLAMALSFISCGNDDEGGVQGYSVTLYSSTDGSSTTIKANEGTVFSELLSKNSITPNASVSSRAAASTSSQYTFSEWTLEDWSNFATSSKITKNITIYAVFSDNFESEESADIVTATSVVVKAYLRGDISTKKETTTTVTNSDGTKLKTVLTEIANADGSSSKEEVKSEIDANGNVTSSTSTKTVTDKSGTTTTTTTDETGKTTVESLQTYSDYIAQGIENLKNEKFDQAVTSFNKAYSIEPNDETRIYSALATLSSIAKSDKTADFFKNHLGITNYPKTLNALISGNWLESAEYADEEDSTRFAKLNVPTWFKNSEFSNELSTLLLANILEGNAKGFDSAIDDLYSVLFGTEFATATERINAITSSITIDEETASELGLSEIWGEGADITVGKAELKLVATALNILKGTFEYIQSLELNTPLDFLKFDWANEDTAIEVLKSKMGKYDASIDPLANGFLGTRSETKLSDSKATFASAIADVIAAYDSIISESSAYPTAFKDKFEEYKILKTGAVALKKAISEGGKFAIPNELPSDETWPEYSEEDKTIAFGIDFGAFFTKDVWKLGNMFYTYEDGKPSIGLGTKKWSYYDDGYTVAQTKSISYYDYENNTQETLNLVLASDENKTTPFLNLTTLETVKKLASIEIENDYLTFLRIRTDRLTPFLGVDWEEFGRNFLYGTTAHRDSTTNENDYYYIYIPLPVEAGLWLYNFYNNGVITSELMANYN